MKYDRVLVTGGAGFIGSHTVEALLDSDVKTWILDDLSSGDLRNLPGVKHNSQLHFVRGSITDYQTIQKLTRKVDAVIHLAAQISPFTSMKYPETTTSTNVNGTLNVLRAATKEKIQKVVFASSSSVYGDFKSQYVSEKLPTNPVSPYGASKLAAEKYCGAFYRAYNLPTISLRYFNVYGQRQSSNPYSGVIAIFTKALIHRRRPIIFGDGNQTRDFIHVSDVASANLRALRTRKGLGEASTAGSGSLPSSASLCIGLPGGLIKGNRKREVPRHAATADPGCRAGGATKTSPGRDARGRESFYSGRMTWSSITT